MAACWIIPTEGPLSGRLRFLASLGMTTFLRLAAIPCCARNDTLSREPDVLDLPGAGLLIEARDATLNRAERLPE